MSTINLSKLPALESFNGSQNPVGSLDLQHNTLFGTLHQLAGTKYLEFTGNPGTATCNNAIATGKGWQIRQ